MENSGINARQGMSHINRIRNTFEETETAISTKAKKMILPTHPEVDSLRMRIPLSLTENVNEETILNKILEISTATGEVIKVKNKGYRIPIDNTFIHVDIKKVVTGKDSKPIECLIILLNSKILGAQYFEGLTKDNIRTAYDKLIQSNLFYVDFETFLHSDCTDIDFKFDEMMNESERIEIVKHIKAITIPERKDSLKTYERPTKTNGFSIGAQFNNRDRASKYRPFIKVYSKGSESKVKDQLSANHNEPTFFESNFNYSDIENVFRVEITLKNREMAKQYGITHLKLRDVLNLPSETKTSLFRNMFSKYTNVNNLRLRTPKTKATISPKDQALFTAFILLIKNTNSAPLNIIEALIQNVDNRRSKSAIRDVLLKLYNESIQGTKLDAPENVKQIGAFYARFGLV